MVSNLLKRLVLNEGDTPIQGARARNMGVGYREKGYPKQDPKNDCLDFVKIETS